MQWIGDTIDAPMTGSLDTGSALADIDHITVPFGRDLLQTLQALQEGNFSIRMNGGHDGLLGQIADAVNTIASAHQLFAQQIARLGEDAGRDGKTRHRIGLGLPGGWEEMENQLNRLIAAMTRAAREAADGAAELERSKSRLQDSEDSRVLALAAGGMGSWDWDLASGSCLWDAGQRQIFGADPASFEVAIPALRALVDRGDWKRLCRQLNRARQNGGAWQLEFRIRRPDGGVRWCLGTAIAAKDGAGRVSRIRGITMDITERKEAEDRQLVLAREVDHRTKNALAVVHAIVSLTQANDIDQFSAAVDGRIQALARAHSLLSDSRWRGAKIADLIQGEFASFRAADAERVRLSGRSLTLHPSAVQALALAVHELAANAARHGALSLPSGNVQVLWEQHDDELALRWIECAAPFAQAAIQDGIIWDGPGRENFVRAGAAKDGLKEEGRCKEGLGMRIIRASIETQLRGSIVFDWRPQGLSCAIRVPCHPKTGLSGDFLYSIQNNPDQHPDAWRKTALS